MNFLRKYEENRVISDMCSKQLNVNPTEFNTYAPIIIQCMQTNTHLEYWRRCGSRIFVLSETLIEAFQNTDIPMRCTPVDFKYPFDCFVVESASKPFFTTKSHGRDEPVHVIMYINENEMYKVLKPFSINPEKFKLEEPQAPLFDHGLTAYIPIHNCPGMERMHFNFKANQTFEDLRMNGKTSPLEMKPEDDDLSKTLNIFYNTVMYINDSSRVPAETEERGSRKIKISGKAETKRQEYILLKAPKSYKALSEYRDERGGILTRFPVRGHWREQAYGEKHLLHKRIWILPFWKGPEMSEIVSSKPYLVK